MGTGQVTEAGDTGGARPLLVQELCVHTRGLIPPSCDFLLWGAYPTSLSASVKWAPGHPGRPVRGHRAQRGLVSLGQKVDVAWDWGRGEGKGGIGVVTNGPRVSSSGDDNLPKLNVLMVAHIREYEKPASVCFRKWTACT